MSEEITEDGADYNLVSSEQKVIKTNVAKKTDTKTVDLGTYLTKEAATKSEMEIDGTIYTLQEISFVSDKVKNRKGTYSHQVTYEDVVSEPTALKELPVSFTDFPGFREAFCASFAVNYNICLF